MSELLKLAERVEALSGPDERVDCLIENALGIAKFERDSKVGYGDADYSRVQPKPYTASLDAAMTLAPEGCQIYVDNGSCDLGAHARILRAGSFVGDAATPALALCAAALRARATGQ